MYNCFNMACHDNTDALQLHIKVNNEKLYPTQQTYNVGSLRIPTDPSWPKIPQRKLAANAGDIIQPPCTVTLTGSPRRSHSIIKATSCQSPNTKSNTMRPIYHHDRDMSNVYNSKRQPGCIDPRFKRVTNSKIQRESPASKEEKHDAPSEIQQPVLTISNSSKLHCEMEKSVPERDIDTQSVVKQNVEKSEQERSTNHISTERFHNQFDPQKLSKSILQTETDIAPQDALHLEDENSKRILDQEVVSNLKNLTYKPVDKSITECRSVLDPSQLTTDITAAENNTLTQAETTILHEAKEVNGQVLFMIEKKIQSQPLNSIHIDTIAIPQHTTQCYNVQVPVLTYQSVPVQISTQAKVDILPQCLKTLESNIQNTNLPNNINAMRECGKCIVATAIKDEYSSLKQSDQGASCVLPQNDTNLQTDIQDICVKENDSSNKNDINIVQSEGATKLFSNHDIPEKLITKTIGQNQGQSSDSEYYLPNLIRSKRQCGTVKHINSRINKSNGLCDETTDSEIDSKKGVHGIQSIKTIYKESVRKNNKDTLPISTTPQKCATSTKHYEETNTMPDNNTHHILAESDKQASQKEIISITQETRQKNKSEQTLNQVKFPSGKKFCRTSEPHITYKRKKPTVNLSRKAKSYFQKNSHSALPDSDYTLIWPGCKHSKRKQSTSANTKDECNNQADIKNTQIKDTVNLINEDVPHKIHMQEKSPNKLNKNFNCLMTENHRIQDHKEETSSRTNVEDSIDQPKGIPLKTQELLNKSYWEYYNKLRHKMNDDKYVEQQYFHQLAMEASQNKRRKACQGTFEDQLKLNPELCTLYQCSALSTVINKTLDSSLQQSTDPMQPKPVHFNTNVKSSSDPTADTQNGVIQRLTADMHDTYEDTTLTPTFINKIHRKKDRHVEGDLLKLKTIVFFGSMMYILIVLLPMLYDYFYHDEYDEENLTYMELILEYVFSSFKEAFGSFFDVVNKIFFQTRTCKKCNNAA